MAVLQLDNFDSHHTSPLDPYIKMSRKTCKPYAECFSTSLTFAASSLLVNGF
jgi:hypothetical protein